MAKTALKRPSDKNVTRPALHLIELPVADPANEGRLGFLDQWRGIAVVFMMAYHFFFDVNLFFPRSRWFGVEISQWSKQFWFWGSVFIGVLFYGIAGASLRALYDRASPREMNRALGRRAAKLAVVSAGVTLGSYFFNPENLIYFGTLHCFAAVTCVMPLITRWRRVARGNALGWIGIGMVAAFFALSSIDFYPWLGNWGIALGLLSSQADYGGDYYPLLPWLGVTLVGFAAFPWLRSRLLDWPEYGGMRWLGRHALWVYLLHQPLLLAGFELAQRLR